MSSLHYAELDEDDFVVGGEFDKSEDFIVPSADLKKMCACVVCKCIQAMSEVEDGCPNGCHSQAGASSNWYSTDFTGILSMMQPTKSWVAKYQRLVHLRPGLYAIVVRSETPPSDDELDDDEFEDEY